MSSETQLYHLVPISSHPDALAKLPPGAIVVQLAAPINQTGAQASPRQPNLPAPIPRVNKWTDPNPALSPRPDGIIVQPIQGPKQPTQPMMPPLDEPVPKPEPALYVQPTISEPEGPQVPRTWQMRTYSFVELGVLLLIFIVAIVSLGNPSTMVHHDMYPADVISQGLGIPSIILVLFSIILIVVLQFIGKTEYHERFVKKALWAATWLWIVGTVINVLIAVGMSIRHKTSMVSAGLGLGIGIMPIHIAGAAIGATAVDKLK